MNAENSVARVLQTNIGEDELFRNYIKDPSIDNRNVIVNQYLYLADAISRKFTNRGIDYDDIRQVAAIALIKAVERFDPEKGVKFISYATPTIIGEIKRFFRDKGSIIRIPRQIYEVYKKVNQAKEHLSNVLQRSPKVDEIAQYLNIGEEAVLEIIESRNAGSVQSFDNNAHSEDELELNETIGENDSTYEKIENRDFLEKSMDRFSQSEKEFIKARYFEGMTQKQIADKLGVSQMYISRMERRILSKFRSILEK